MFKYFIIMLLINGTSFASDTKGGGGGILQSALFAKLGREAIQALSQGDKTINFEDIILAIKDTKVIPVEKICYREPVYNQEFCEDAHYDQSNNMILFNLEKWKLSKCEEKFILSSHEYLRAAGLEGEDYRYSGRFVDWDFVKCEATNSSGLKECQKRNYDIRLRLANLCASTWHLKK